MVARSEIWWTDVGRSQQRPVLVVQCDEFNMSKLGTVICVLITSDLRYSGAPGNVLITARESGLPRDTVVNVAHVVTLDRSQLSSKAGAISTSSMEVVSSGLRMAQGLSGPTRHTAFPTSSATSRPPRLSSATPTGLPFASPLGRTKPVRTSTGSPEGLPRLKGTKITL